MTASPSAPPPSFYAVAAPGYLVKGWKGVLPLPPRSKGPVPEGFTGKVHFDVDPTPEDVAGWSTRPNANIALRMPRNIIGIDVDAYGTKPGGLTLEDAQSNMGGLPPTWRSTARDDGVSGIRFYRVPEGLQWPNTVGPGIEMIHRGHRYAVCWPSTHPDTGSTYRWITPEGVVSMDIPSVDSLPELPDEWVEGLTQGEAMRPAAPRSEVEWATVQSWLTPGAPCRQVAKLVTRFTEAMGTHGSRHDSGRDLSLALLFLGQQGHTGVSSALDKMTDQFIAAVSKDRGSESSAAQEWASITTGAEAIVAGAPRPIELCLGDDTCGTIQPLEGLSLDVLPRIVPPSEMIKALEPEPEQVEQFWNARLELSHIRDFARSRRSSPWAVLGAVLVRITCMLGPALVLPPLRGGEASLNLFVGLVGRSGGGKGAAEQAAKYAFTYGGHQAEVTVGSGEGIAHSYMRYRPAKKDDPGGVEQHETSVLFRAAEVDTLGALKDRSGSTLLSQLRNAYSGDTLGFGYASVEKRLIVPAHVYRLGLIVGIQPLRADALLNADEEAGGTPQRFLWLPTTDPDAPRARPPEVMPLTWRKPSYGAVMSHPGTGRKHIPVCARAADEVDEEAYKSAHDEGHDGLDGHRLLTKLKVAAALSALDGRIGVEDGDWDLAEVIMAKSDHTREWIKSRMMMDAKSRAQSRAVARGQEQATVSETVENRAIARARVRVLELVGAEPTALSSIRRRLTASQRDVLEDAIHGLAQEEKIKVTETGRGTVVEAL